MKKYTVRTSCEIAGVWREAGSTLELTDEQARELAPPFGRVVLPVVIIERPANGRIPRHTRQNRRGAK
jgi:hypothetical protein